MHYKTIVLGLIEDQPQMHRQLKERGTLLQTLEQLATALSYCHAHWMESLAARNSASDRTQLSSQAMELAHQELQDSLQHASEASDEELLPLDAAMAFIRRHTPPAS